MEKKVLPGNQVLLDMDLEIEEEGKADPVVLEEDMAVVDGIVGGIVDGIEILAIPVLLVQGVAVLEDLPGLPGLLPDGETIEEEAQVAIEVRRVPVDHTDDIIFRFQGGAFIGLVQTLKT